MSRARFHPTQPRSPRMRKNVSWKLLFFLVFSLFGGKIVLLRIFLVVQDEAPKGMLARGHYDAASKFVDDDNVTHLQFEWSFDIAKDWK